MENSSLPKSISNTDTVNILARIDKLRKIHALNVANRFNLSLTEVKIMGFIRWVAGEGNFVASYIMLEQRKYLDEIFNGFTHDERVMMGRMLWKIDRNVRHVLMKNKIKQEHGKMG